MVDLEALKQWIGRKETATDYITIPSVHRLSATLDRDDTMPKTGDVLPTGWHSILFPRVVRQSQIGHDGHPKRGDFLPPVPLPRRMFAGNRIWFHEPLLIGDEVQRESSIKDVSMRQGSSGDMIFVMTRTEITGPRGLAIVEEQDIVYREERASAQSVKRKPEAEPGVAAWKRTLTPDPVLLFRYSALSFNGHRIHYDFPYVTEKEHYPNLVMTGRLTLLLVFELVRANTGARIAEIASRNVAPMYVDRPLTLCGAPDAEGRTAKLWVLDDKNKVALSATAKLS